MKRIMLVFIVIIALLVSMTACTKIENDPQNEVTTSPTNTTPDITTKAPAVTTTQVQTTTTKKEETQIVNPFAEKMTINWLLGTYSSHLYEEGRWDELELEEKFNIDLKMWNVQIDSSNMEQIQMMLAAGDVPDYGFYYTTGRYLVENGLGRTINLNMIKEYYPSYYKMLNTDPVGLEFNKVEDAENEYYGFTGDTVMANYTGHVPMWRLDWLESLGYKLDNLVPLSFYAHTGYDNNVYFSNTKFSVDDVKEIYRAFTEDDPDGNGVDDTYGSAFSNTWYDVYTAYGMFGYDTDGNHFYKDPNTGDYVPYYAYTPYKENLKFLTEMINNGYMRRIPGLVSYYDELIATWRTGKTGFMNALSGSSILGYNLQAVNRPPLSILETEPDAKFVITPTPGVGKFRPYWTFNWSEGYTHPVGINVDDTKLIRLMQLLEYAYFGDNWLRYKWGIEGIHYKWAGEAFNSPLIKTDPNIIPVKYAGKGTNVFGQFGNISFVTDDKVYNDYDAFTIQMVDYFDQYSEGGWKSNKLWIRPGKYFSNFTMPSSLFEKFKTLRTETNAEISAVHSDFSKRVWGGQIANMDTEWEQYIEQIYAAGLNLWVKIWNDDQIKTFDYYSTIK